MAKVNTNSMTPDTSPLQRLAPRISQEEGLVNSSSGLSGSWAPYQPPQPGNQDCRYWIIPELPLLGTEAVGEASGTSLFGSRTFCKTEFDQYKLNRVVVLVKWVTLWGPAASKLTSAISSCFRNQS